MYFNFLLCLCPSPARPPVTPPLLFPLPPLPRHRPRCHQAPLLLYFPPFFFCFFHVRLIRTETDVDRLSSNKLPQNHASSFDINPHTHTHAHKIKSDSIQAGALFFVLHHFFLLLLLQVFFFLFCSLAKGQSLTYQRRSFANVTCIFA